MLPFHRFPIHQIPPSLVIPPSQLPAAFKQESGDEVGVLGISTTSHGVVGVSTEGYGVEGSSTDNVGVLGDSTNSAGVLGISDTGSGVYASSTHGVGLVARGGAGAAQFDGDVQITGTLYAKVDVVLGADCAEEFDVAATEEIEPGTVMVLSEDGPLQPSQQAYDKKVAGVISGAGEYQPGLILDRKASAGRRLPVALVGKVYCKVDATYAPISVGDLLTTSPTPGHAMKADDPVKAFGAVIGKALRPLPRGQGLIPILIALQ